MIEIRHSRAATMSGRAARACFALLAVAVLAAAAPDAAAAQPAQPRAPRPTIEARTEGLERLDGYLPLFWDAAAGRLFMEIGRFDTEILYIAGLASGLGSNDIGLDRGILQGSTIVTFERAGPRVMMVQPNYRFRSTSDNPAEVRAVRDAFARSILWGFDVVAETGGRALVDLTDFLVRDATNITPRLRPGTYRLEPSRSAIYRPMTMNFPRNTELEVELTFVRQPGPAGGVPPFFEGVPSVAATGEAASLRVHHSFVALPDDGYTPRAWDPRSGFGAVTWEDYSAPISESMTRRFIRRHRLVKRDPTAAVSEPVEPIVYYLDPGTPEPVRTALLDGARWWADAFEAAGFRNAYRVEMLPEGVSTHDVRYNVINWVHRSTRGWSTGASVVDPRTGEILKGVVTLGSLRVRQDYMLAEGLLSPYVSGDERPADIEKWALDRIRQLSAHEVGHTLGLGHNFYSSTAGRISVMDYPHPLVRLRDDGSFDYSEVYDLAIGEWDKLAIRWGYSQFAPGADEQVELERILQEKYDRDMIYLSNQDLSAHPRVDQWSNGADAAAELGRMMRVRRAALDRFGEAAIRTGAPLATMEEVLVPLYLHHRYQVDATVSLLGGVDYVYAMRGDGRRPYRFVSAAEQRTALDALLATLRPAELVVPRAVVDRLPPRPSGYGRTRELFPRHTGPMFDVVAPAVVAADMVVGGLLEPQRAARLVQQHALDPALPSLDAVIDALHGATFGARPASPYEAEVARAVQRVFIDRLGGLATDAGMPQVRAIATARLERYRATLLADNPSGPTAEAAHRALIARDIGRLLDRPLAGEYTLPEVPVAPPGAPIGQPPLDWLGRLEPPCSFWFDAWDFQPHGAW